jgi:hypothetical protein
MFGFKRLVSMFLSSVGLDPFDCDVGRGVEKRELVKGIL